MSSFSAVATLDMCYTCTFMGFECEVHSCNTGRQSKCPLELPALSSQLLIKAPAT